ncbi:MAG: PIN domain-containing protein [Planctomycetes bacterium]|nr:PIN domain-containing protein [Planctomycetota bacterium]
MTSWVIRAVFILICAGIILFIFQKTDVPESEAVESSLIYITAFFTIILVLAGLSVDLFVKKKSIAALTGLFFGLLMGGLIGAGFSLIVNLLYESFATNRSPEMIIFKDFMTILITTFCCYLSVVFVMQSKDDFRFIVPYVEFSKQAKGSIPFILDTSVIIDGRIADIAETRILTSAMVVPRFVLNELQNIADSADRLRRNRGRRGLDILNKLQSCKNVDVSIEDIVLNPQEQAEPVDHKLVATGKKMGGKIVTNDYNLNKVAGLRGVEVININDLANALKPVALPGEPMKVKIVKNGDQTGQGVGYMDDGTMVVVENGEKYVQQTVDLTVTSVLQTSAGRMIFGKVEESNEPERHNQHGGGGQRRQQHNNQSHSRNNR